MSLYRMVLRSVNKGFSKNISIINAGKGFNSFKNIEAICQLKILDTAKFDLVSLTTMIVILVQ